MSSRRIVQAVAAAFLGVAAGGAVLILAWGPTGTPYRLLGFLGSEFVLTGAVVVAVILWAIGQPRCGAKASDAAKSNRLTALWQQGAVSLITNEMRAGPGIG